MAELIVSPIAEKIMSVLASEAVKEIALIWGVKDDLEHLQETISTIKAVLADAEKKQVHNNQVKLWLQRLEDAFLDADDLMDEFDSETLRQQVMPGSKMTNQVRTFFSSSNQLGFRYKMGHRIRVIERELAKIKSDRSFHLDERSHENGEVVKRDREDHSFVRQEDVIGREDDRNEIIRLVFDDDKVFMGEGNIKENVAIIPIVGMGGLGKTMLAQNVFNDVKVQQHFEPRKWACVSDPFELRSVIQQIIGSTDNGESLDKLQNRLRELVKGKRYLLVLDDVWEEKREKWLKLRELLVDGAKGSRVIVTTRSGVVAKITGTSQPYQLGILDGENSWSLFKRMAFVHGQEPKNLDLVEIAKDIASKCGGVPLALRAIGNALYAKSLHLETWSSFYKEFSNVVTQEQENNILSVLKLSYDHLSPNLKRCFAYCRLFPKDYIIDVPKLIKLWMAQDFMKSSYSSDQCMEDVGYGYFINLYERSFFQDAYAEYDVILSCKMHDLVHDLAVTVSGLRHETLSDNSKGIVNKNTRHVSFNWPTEQIHPSLLNASKLRTIILVNDIFMNSSIVLLRFKLLRTLDLSNLCTDAVPDSIGKLKHLRYLDLSRNTAIKRLPSSITNLLNLQTLKLSNCGSLEEIPVGIEKLVKLRHLEIDGCDELTHMPVGLSHLTDLQTLPMYVLPKRNSPAPCHAGDLRGLAGLNNLRGSLTISNLRDGNKAESEYRSANLMEKRHLRSLRLHWLNDCDETMFPMEANTIVGYEMALESLQPHLNIKELLIWRYIGVKWSSWVSSLTNLVSLSLWDCKNCTHLFPISQFHSLNSLDLNNLPSLECIEFNSTCSSSSASATTLLPSLKSLFMSELPNLKGWWREPPVSGEAHQPMSFPYFPTLSWLDISRCPKLMSMPLFPHLDDQLYLYATGMKTFEMTVLQSKATTMSHSPLSKLRKLHISEVEDLQCLPDWFESFTSLEDLHIGDCSEFKDMTPGLRHLTSLQELSVWNCNSLRSIPECIDSINSLRELTFGSCLNLASLPEGIRSLTSLKTMHIQSCPMLLKRCKRQIGEDWPKIAHIPHLNLYEEETDSDAE